MDLIFTEFKKASPQSIEENNGLLWAKKIFKTKPNRTVSEEFKSQIKTIFHHLTKDELVDKIIANYLAQNKPPVKTSESSKMGKKN